jgi:hypothetical protein
MTLSGDIVGEFVVQEKRPRGLARHPTLDA